LLEKWPGITYVHPSSGAYRAQLESLKAEHVKLPAAKLNRIRGKMLAAPGPLSAPVVCQEHHSALARETAYPVVKVIREVETSEYRVRVLFVLGIKELKYVCYPGESPGPCDVLASAPQEHVPVILA